MTPKLSIIIPSANPANVAVCVWKLLDARPTLNLQVIVVEDWKTPQPDIEDMLARRNVWVIPGERPFCFARNVNLGIKAAGDQDVVILNDDAILKTPGGFAAMQKAALGDLEFGVVSAATNNTGNTNQEQRYEFAKDCKGFIREEKRMVCFVAVFIPRSIIDAVGLLDESFTGYGYDDDDYCLRVRQAGLKIGIFDGCVVDHSQLEPTYRRAGLRGQMRLNDLTEHNRKIFIAKHGADRLEV